MIHAAHRASGLMDRIPQKLRWKKDIESYYDMFVCQMVRDSLHQQYQYDPKKASLLITSNPNHPWESKGPIHTNAKPCQEIGMINHHHLLIKLYEGLTSCRRWQPENT